jgi:hypothetical protein
MEDRLDQAARGPRRPGREGLRRLGRRLRAPAQWVDRTEAQPFDFDALAMEVAQGLSRREALRRLGAGLGVTLLAALGLERGAPGATRRAAGPPVRRPRASPRTPPTRPPSLPA